jgi:hypothetical protein
MQSRLQRDCTPAQGQCDGILMVILLAAHWCRPGSAPASLTTEGRAGMRPGAGRGMLGSGGDRGDRTGP